MNEDDIIAYQVVQGFLNLSLSDAFWSEKLDFLTSTPTFWQREKRNQKVMVEFSSPNTNKPLHLGHIRNNLLGWSCSKLFEASGYDVVKVQIINDRGIAICKSMLAWQRFAGGSTPDSVGVKSDHFVGEWYVRFEQEFKKEYAEWQAGEVADSIYNSAKKEEENTGDFYKRYKNTYFNEYSALGTEAKDMLLKWEANDSETRALWEQMNQWVYDGFEDTYQRLGIHFDKLYFESQTYLLGKKTIEKGLEKKVFFKKEDGSVWVDLSDEGMDEKILLRSDGTSVYMTQDLGTAQMRAEDFSAEKMIYITGDEQIYHFKALFAILKKMEEPYADGLHHLPYGMVDLPTGKMKSREGTVVDADDLIDDVIGEATSATEERGEIAGLSAEEQKEVLRKIGMAALKFFIIKVNPQKRMIFDPKASVDMRGQTGPYIQNAFVRIQSILRNADTIEGKKNWDGYDIQDQEKQFLSDLMGFPVLIDNAAHQFDPSLIANYCYNLAQDFHRYYHDVRILKAESDEARIFRLELIKPIAHILEVGMDLLGIEMPERM